MDNTDAITRLAADLSHDDLVDALLRRGWHEDYLDEASFRQLADLYDSGATADDR